MVAIAAEKETYQDSTLADYGFTTRESDFLNRLDPQERLDVITQEVESITREALADEPVSNPFHYWSDSEGNLYSHPSKKEVYMIKNNINAFFDPRERGNLPWYGFQSAISLLREKENQVVLLYSPIGKTTFEKDYRFPHDEQRQKDNIDPSNPYQEIGKYPDGQLYVFYRTGDQFNGVGLKTSSNEVIEQFVPGLHKYATAASDEEQQIARYMLNPAPTTYSIDDFLARAWSNEPMYTSKEARVYSVQEVLSGAREAFAGRQKKLGTIRHETLQELQKTTVSSRFVFNMFLRAVEDYAASRGITGTMRLSGSCGGKEVDVSDIHSLLGIESVNDIMSPMSSVMRAVAQGGNISEALADSTTKSVEFTGVREVACICGKKVRITRENFSKGKLACDCGAELSNKCDVEAVYESGKAI